MALGQGVRSGAVVQTWLKKLFKAEFHATPKCSRSAPSTKSHIHNLYCTTCMGKAYCSTCDKTKHSGHGLIIQAYRSSRQSAVDPREIRDHIDTSTIDKYAINHRSVVYIHSRKPRRNNENNNNSIQLGAKCPCGARLYNGGDGKTKFCSLFCKAKDMDKGLEEEENEYDEQKQQEQNEDHEHQQQLVEHNEEEQEDGQVPTEIIRLIRPFKKRKKSRKQLNPIRSPLF